jgi:nucleoside-diphosphate-sugar epimerase
MTGAEWGAMAGIAGSSGVAARAEIARVLPNGGSGLLGRNLIPALLGKGLRVRALARSDAALAVVAGLGAEPVCSSLDDVVALHAGMARCDVAFHLAPTPKIGRYEDTNRANDIGTEHVLALCAASCTCVRWAAAW